MFPAERRREIEKIVNTEGAVSITELSKKFNVSDMTIHRDLSALEVMGVIEKTRGGAVAYRPYSVPTEYRNRIKSNEERKAGIGKKAVEFIKEGDMIFLGPGTTSLQVARYLWGIDNLVVYTNGPAVILELAKIPSIEVHCTGGMLSPNVLAYIGPETEKIISQIRPDKCFIGAHALTIANGVTDPMSMEASFKRKVVEVSHEVYLVVTPDKFGHVSSHVSVPIEAIDVIITSEDAPELFINELEVKKIHCVLAPKNA